MMTRKHFEAIAEAIREDRYGDSRDEPLDQAADNLANRLSKFNPSFDRQRFLKACGVED